MTKPACGRKPAPHMAEMEQEGGSLLPQALILLAAGVLAVPLTQRLRLGPVLGYLVAGVAVGPHGFRLVPQVEDVRALAEFGVVFLLFTIGLELKLARLIAMKRLVFGLGSAQVAVTAAALAGIAAVFPGVGWRTALVIGGGLALSSTAVVLQMLADRGEIATRPGRTAFAVLLMQDLAVVPLLMMVSAMGGGSEPAPLMLLQAAGRALLVGAAIVVAGRLLVRRFLHVAAASRSAELLAAATLLVILGTAWATQKAGLSMALGAFMAGLLMAETEYRHQVEADIQPFRGLLLGLFFITVGMGLDLGLLARHLGAVLLMLAGLIVVKAALLAALVRLSGFGWDDAAHVGLVLAQGGEFAFVVFGQAAAKGVMGPEILGPLTLAVTASMFVTPLLMVAGSALGARLRRHPGGLGRLEEMAGLSDHVIVAGYGRMGRTIGRLLELESVRWVALEASPDPVAAARERGQPVFFGDPGRAEVLRAAGAERARAIVLAQDNPAAVDRALATITQRFPDVPVVARAHDRRHSDALHQAGAARAVPETMEASLQLGVLTLMSLGTPAARLNRLLEEVRRDNYAGLTTAQPGDDREG